MPEAEILNPETDEEREYAPKKEASRDDEALLREIRNRFDAYGQFWSENYKEGDRDMDTLSAEYGPWPDEEIRMRKELNRPVVHIDIISQFPQRIINQLRLNPRGITVLPKGSDANDETATLREDRIRQMDYESSAEHIRLQAVADAIRRGLGFYWVTTEWARQDDFEQRIVTEATPNPSAVMFDPYCRLLDFSDMNGAFKIERYEYGRYRSEFPDARIRSFQDEYLRIAPKWIDEKSIQVCEYWKRTMKKRTLLMIESPEGPTKLFLDEIEGGEIKKKELIVDGRTFRILKQRTSDCPKVKQFITNGLEILKRKDWVGSTIPLIVVTGERKYEKGKFVVESLTRRLRAPQLKYDYAVTGEFEVLGMTPKSHWSAVVGQTEEFPEWADANRDPTPVLRHRATTEATGQNILPAPQRIDYSPPIEAYEMAMQSALVAAQQAAGMYSVERKDRTAKSGKAIERLNQEQDIGNYHFSDYLDFAVQYEGRIKNEILRHIEDTDAVRGFRSEDDKYEQKRVTPTADPESGELAEHPYGKGRDHDVIVKAGPSMQSQWEKASDFLDLLAQNPQFAPIVMDLVVLMKQLGPMGKKLAERFEKLLPPQLQEQKEGQAPPIPPQIAQQLQQMKELIQALTQQLNEANQQLQGKQLETDAKVHMNQLDNAVKLSVAEIQAKVKENADSVSAFLTKMDATLELILQGQQHAHEANMGSQQADLQREQHMLSQQSQEGENS